MRRHLVRTALWLTALFAVQCHGLRRLPRQNSNQTYYFHSFSWHSSIALSANGGDYLYIDGGVETAWDGLGNGIGPIEKLITDESVHTRAISLQESWTPENATFHRIEKHGAPTNLRTSLWEDAEGDAFYMYNGGGYMPDDADTTNNLWKFTPDGNSGTWELVAPSPQSNFTSLVRTWWSLNAGANGLGFALGGLQSAWTDSRLSEDDATLEVPGLIMYNDTSSEWWNISAAGGYSGLGTAARGAAHFAPDFGPEGLFFVLGGFAEDGVFVSFNELYMFEPTKQQWRRQEVSGDLPSPSAKLCATGLKGDNGTYEIFLHGGKAVDIESSIAQGAVWSLTLPAFHWQKHAVDPEFGRAFHACNIVGNRQMVVTGGLIMTTESGIDAHPPDPWPNGLGIFDLTNLEWSTHFDANAAPYTTADVIKDYYRANGSFPSSWTEPETQEWFDPSVARSTTPETNSPQADAGANQPDQPSGSGTTNTGAIVGGAVGGLAAIAIVAAVIFCVRRRKKREAGNRPPENVTPEMPSHWQHENAYEKDSHVRSAAELPGERERQELWGVHPPQELKATERYEM